MRAVTELDRYAAEEVLAVVYLETLDGARGDDSSPRRPVPPATRTSATSTT
jgi:hypothetical protein